MLDVDQMIFYSFTTNCFGTSSAHGEGKKKRSREIELPPYTPQIFQLPSLFVAKISAQFNSKVTNSRYIHGSVFGTTGAYAGRRSAIPVF